MAARWAAFITQTDSDATKDWTYKWRDLTRTAGAMLVYDPASEDQEHPLTIVYFELTSDSWIATGGDNCSTS